MNAFSPVPISVEDQDDLRADARADMFFALREAFNKRSQASGLKAKDLSEILCKNKSYVSRVLNGTQDTIDYETLYVFMHALGYHLPINPVAFEDLACKRANFDAKPKVYSTEENKPTSLYEARFTHMTLGVVDATKIINAPKLRVREITKPAGTAS